jgi:hypothetical protein
MAHIAHSNHQSLFSHHVNEEPIAIVQIGDDPPVKAKPTEPSEAKTQFMLPAEENSTFEKRYEPYLSVLKGNSASNKSLSKLDKKLKQLNRLAATSKEQVLKAYAHPQDAKKLYKLKKQKEDIVSKIETIESEILLIIEKLRKKYWLALIEHRILKKREQKLFQK